MRPIAVPHRRRSPAAMPRAMPAAPIPPSSDQELDHVISSVPAAGAETEPEHVSNGPGAHSNIPPRWAVGLVCVVLVSASVLVGMGHPVGIVLDTLAAAGALGVELVRLLES